MKKEQLLGGLIMIIASLLTWYFYDWKLPVFIIMFLWGNNLESKK